MLDRNVTLKGNEAGVTVEGEALTNHNTFHASLNVAENGGAVAISGNEVGGP